jgi:phosphocarrier protein HPr
MYMQQSIVKCESGLYNRQATYFIQKANEFKSSIWVEVEDRKINAKSLLGVLSMGITKGTRVSIIAEGPDEEEAVKALTDMLVKEVFCPRTKPGISVKMSFCMHEIRWWPEAADA